MRFLLFIFIALMSVSCGTQKPVISANDEPKRENISPNHQQFYEMIGKKSSFDAVKISSKIDVQLGKSIPTIDATIYIENGQKIWVNMSAFFINMARAMATPQGLKAYEKIENTYVDSDFSYLNHLLNIGFLDYSAVQNLLVGKVFIPIQEKDFTLKMEGNGYVLTSKNGIKIGKEKAQKEYLMTLHFSQNFNLTQVLVKDTQSADNLEIHYPHWQNINGEHLPKSVKIIIKGKKNGQILIENTKFDFSKMETPYSVPNHYKKRVF